MKETFKSLALRWLPDGWLLALKTRRYVAMLRRFDVSDEPDMSALPTFVQPGDCVVDLGANIGAYTKRLSEIVGAKGTVVSVEPVPQTFAILRECVRQLGLTNVRLVDEAVSDTVGAATMSIPHYPSGGENYYESRVVSDEDAPANERHVRVRTTTLDALLNGLAPTFIKCDVEGHERAVIAGAAKTLARCRPAWLIEFSDDPDDPKEGGAELLRQMRSLGYSLWVHEGGGLRERRPGDRSANYFFLAAKHLKGSAGVHA